MSRSQGQVRARPDTLGFGNLRLSVGSGDGTNLSEELGWQHVIDLVSTGERESELAEVGVAREDPVDQRRKCLLMSYLRREPVVEGIPEMHQSEGKVFVKEVAEKLAHAVIRPAAMDQEQTLEIAELGEGEVAVEHGLRSLLSADADPNVGSCKRNPRSFLVTDLVCRAPSLESVKGRLRSWCTNPLLYIWKTQLHPA